MIRKKYWCSALTSGLVMVAVLLTITGAGTAEDPPTKPPDEKKTPNGQSPMLTMVLIRTSSSGEIKKLRAMHIDIIRIRSDPERQTNKHSFGSGWIAEAVIPRHLLPKLKAKGFEVSEVPQKKNDNSKCSKWFQNLQFLSLKRLVWAIFCYLPKAWNAIGLILIFYLSTY